MAEALLSHSDELLSANQLDIACAKDNGLSSALTERLTLSPTKIEAMSQGILDVLSLPDPIGELIDCFKSPDGLIINKIRVPLGLLMMIYESRPNVTADAAVLALKSGNAMILKGGKESIHTNQKIADILIQSGLHAGMPEHAIQFISSSDRSLTNALLTDVVHVDAIIPRGGPALKKAISTIAKVPILMTGSGVCHLYIAPSAEPEMAKAIAINAKTHRPGVCNAIETLLIHQDYSETANLLLALLEKGVQLRVCERSLSLLRTSGAPTFLDASTPSYILAEAHDYEEEYLDLILSVKIVANTDEAITHISTYGTGHSESIVTLDLEEAETFLNQVDAACVYHNASTRFTDGGCFGFGCEIGIATQKLHARGPMGLREITSYKYQIHGTGQIRK